MKPTLDPRTSETFGLALDGLTKAKARFVVAGAFALHAYTGLWRSTKDLDLSCRPEDSDEILRNLEQLGFTTHVEERHWLGKAHREGALVDVIWGCGNWACFVDDRWFETAQEHDVLGSSVLVMSPEDLILSKAYVAGRERFDGTDISHLLHACGPTIDWDLLIDRFADHWPLLLHYLVLYRFVYPEDRARVPATLIHELSRRIGTDAEVRDGLSFRGPLLDRYGYLFDLDEHALTDPRELLAERAGLPLAAVRVRRQLDAEALREGRPYRYEKEAKGER